MKWMVDTNVWLRLHNPGDPQHSVVKQTVADLIRDGGSLCYCFGIARECRFNSLRPSPGGFGLSLQDFQKLWLQVESHAELLPEHEPSFREWKTIVDSPPEITGIRVHDAAWVAVAKAHGVGNLLTIDQELKTLAERFGMTVKVPGTV